MKVFVTSTALALLSLASFSVADHYALSDSWTASNFFSGFNFYTGNDPTHGFVNYVDQGTAQNSGLINTNNNKIYMGVDYTTTNPGGRGRNSVRIESKKQYTHGLFILDLNHMPSNICGVWPAFWTYGPNWPNSGEIDILEGVNDQTSDFVSLHTGGACKATSGAGFNGQLTSNDCAVSTGGGTGCSIHSTNTATYGAGLNNVGGGVYAMEWGSWGIKITFFARNKIPSDITNGAPQPATWPQPMAYFPSNGNCNVDANFANHWVVFDTTFCGDWAGDQNLWNADANCHSKAATCQAYVAGNPSAFQQAYWDINSLKIYQGAPNKMDSSTPSNATRVETVEEPSFILSDKPSHAMGPNGGSIGAFHDDMKQGHMVPGRNWNQGAFKRHMHGHGAHGRRVEKFF